MIALVVVTDGRREFIPQAIASIYENVQGINGPRVMVNDAAEDPQYGYDIVDKFGPDFRYFHHPVRRGLAFGIRQGWSAAIENPAVRYIWHHEDDYVVPDPIDLNELAQALNSAPTLAELTLKRDPYSSEEAAAGDYMKVGSHHYEDAKTPNGFEYVRHDQIFFSQPSLIPRAVAEACIRTNTDLTEPGLRDILTRLGYHFGVVGKIEDRPRVRHIGNRRSLHWQA